MPFELLPPKLETETTAVGEQGRTTEIRSRDVTAAERMWSNVRGVFTNESELNAKAQNAIAMSEEFNIPINQAWDNHEAISESTFNNIVTTPELIGVASITPIVAGLAAHPVSVGLGLAFFEGLSEAENAAISIATGEEYKVFQHKGLSELLPDDASRMTKEVVDIFDIVWKAAAAGGLSRKSPKAIENLTREVIETHNLPKEVYIDGAQLKKELQTGNILAREEFELVKSLGLKGSEYRQAVNDGLFIKIPSEKTTTLQPKAWYAKLRSLLKLEPIKPETVTETTGKVETKFGKQEEQKLLPRNSAIERLPANDPIAEIVKEHQELPGRFEHEVAQQLTIAEQAAKLGKPELVGKSLDRVEAELQKLESEFGEDAVFAEELELIEKTLDAPVPIEKNLGHQNQGWPKEDFKAAVKSIEEENLNVKTSRTYKPGPLGAAYIRPDGVYVVSDAHFDIPVQLVEHMSTGAYVRLTDNFKGRGGIIYIEVSRTPTQSQIKEIKNVASQHSDIIVDVIMAGDKAPRSERFRDIGNELLNSQKVVKYIKEQTDFVETQIVDIPKVKTPKTQPKKTIREITGQTKVKNILSVDEMKGLKKQIQFEARAAREGLREGKRIVTEKNKAKRKADIAKYRANKAAAKEIKSLSKNIAKPPSNIDMEHHDLIKEIQSFIDIDKGKIAKRTKATKKERAESLQQLLDTQEATGIEIPLDMIRSLQKKTLDDFSIQELRDLSEELTDLREAGKFLKDFKDGQRRIREQSDIQNINSEILGTKELAPEETIRVPRKPKPTTAVDMVKSLRTASKTPTRLIRKYAGGKLNSRMETAIWDELHNARSNTAKQVRIREKAIDADYKRLKLTRPDMNKPHITIDGKELTLGESIGIYMFEQNRLAEIAIQTDNGFTPEQVKEIISSLKPNHKKMGDAFIDNFRPRKDEIRRVFFEIKGQDLPIQKNYFTMIREAEITDKVKGTDEEIIENLLSESEYGKELQKGLRREFTEGRVERGEEPRRLSPIRLDVHNIFDEVMPAHEKFINEAETLRHVNAIINDKSFRKSLEQVHGNEAVAFMDYYKSINANKGNFTRTHNQFDKTLRIIRTNSALSFLAWNTLTIGKQLPSVFLYLGRVGFGDLFNSAQIYAQNPKAAIDFVKGKSPLMNERFLSGKAIERDMAEIQELDHGLYNDMIRTFGKVGMKGIMWMDRQAITIGWRSVYEKNLALGEKAAVLEADKATMDTQVGASPLESARMFYDGEASKAISQFGSQPNKIFNIVTEDIGNYMKEDSYTNAAQAAGGVGLAAMIFWSITQGRLPKDKEDFIDGLTDTALMMNPYFGRAALAAKQGYDYNLVSLDAIEKFGKLVVEGVKDPLSWSNVDRAAFIASIMTANPYLAEKRLVQSFTDKDPFAILFPPVSKRKRKQQQGKAKGRGGGR